MAEREGTPLVHDLALGRRCGTINNCLFRLSVSDPNAILESGMSLSNRSLRQELSNDVRYRPRFEMLTETMVVKQSNAKRQSRA